MNIIDILKDKFLILLLNIILFMVMSIAIIAIDIGIVVIFLVFCIWFIPLMSYMLIEAIKLKRYYNEMHTTMESLEKKYLLPEIARQSNSIEGKVLNEIMKTICREMHEHVNYYSDMQSEYREYIETWVHEVKTPIASAKLIIENNSSPVTKKINSQIDRIDDYIEQALYYSRSNGVSNDYMVKSFSLNTAVTNVLKRNSRDFISKKIKLDLGDIEQTVYSDSKWVEFIVNQIIGNAIKYSKKNKGMIRINALEEKNSVTLSIEDNGMGISERDLGRVFEKGFTGENGRLFGKATGMGLYLCKKLSGKLGLGIKIQSESGVGTKVDIVFPIGRLNYK